MIDGSAGFGEGLRTYPGDPDPNAQKLVAICESLAADGLVERLFEPDNPGGSVLYVPAKKASEGDLPGRVKRGESDDPTEGWQVLNLPALKEAPSISDPTAAAFKAYGPQGELTYAVWTNSPGTEAAERAVFQERLSRGDLSAVDIAYGDPLRRNETLLPTCRREV